MDSAPSAERFLQMGSLAKENEFLWFWRRAGVDMKRIERWISLLEKCSARTPKKLEAAKVRGMFAGLHEAHALAHHVSHLGLISYRILICVLAVGSREAHEKP
jgi:hypothetical protein